MSKILTTKGLNYFAGEFNKLVDGKLVNLSSNVELKLSQKADLGHNHDNDYANKALTEAHIADGSIHITEAERVQWNEYKGLITAIQNTISGTSKIKVVANMAELNSLEGCIEGDIVYVLDATGHAEAADGEALGFIYADLGQGLGWAVFSDLKPALEASKITIDQIAELSGVTDVQGAIEAILVKIAGVEAKFDAKVEEIETELEELNRTVTRLDNECTDLNKTNLYFNEQLNIVKGRVDGHDTKIASIEAEVATVKQNVVDAEARLDAKIAETNTRIDAVEADIEQKINVALEEITDSIGELDIKIDGVEGKFDTEVERLDGEVERIDGEIAGLKAKDVELEEKIAQLEAKDLALDAKDAELAAKDAELEEAIAGVRTDLTNLEARVQTNEGNIEAIQGEIEDIDNRISSLETQVGEDLQGAIEQLRQDLLAVIGALEVRVKALEDKAVEIEGNVAAIDGRVQTVEGKLAGIEEGAEVNQNAFAKVKVGEVVIEAGEKSAELEIGVVADCGLTINATGNKVEIGVDALTEADIDEIIAGLSTVTPS